MAVTNSAAARPCPLDSDASKSHSRPQVASGTAVPLIDADSVAFAAKVDADAVDDSVVSPGCRSAVEDRDFDVTVFEGGIQAHVVVVVVASGHGEGFDVRVAGQGTFVVLGRGTLGTLLIVAVGTMPKAGIAVVFAVFLQATPAESGGAASPAETIAGTVLCALCLHGAQVNIGDAADVLAVGPLGSVLEKESALDVSVHLAVSSAAAAFAMNTVRL